MRAARYYGKEDIRVEEVEVDPCGDGQVRVAPSYVGICGTDLHEFLGGPTFAPVTPHPLSRESIPITLGHEFSGVVSEKGGFIGLSGGGGGLSDSVVVPQGSVLSLPEQIPLEIGALVEPLSVAWHAVSAAALLPESTVLVLGGGPIGLAVVQCLVALKTKKIIMSEVSKTRQRFAKEFGAHHVLDPKTYDLVAISRELSGQGGPDVVFDCAGVPASLVTACRAVKPRGTVVNVAIWEREVPFQPNMLVFKEAHYTAVLGYQREDFQAVIDHLANGTLKPDKMITSTISLDDVVEGGIKALIKDKESHVKILVKVGGP
ncbi:uncharacterized protein N0V89_003651 [Didymosphaeria variabile]|uniref:Enoyl reductase (ER) domain-containing protein n=1 Tax=Didymosphaeria variabile TaxID=1932322 RepID=A0A9W9CCX2_9PLEO|nr:uncharacterized protein N0V89_003651 [Didymosphaeria variabile]KAJ4355631.1 hypothetical protein N0V89_003651 [Didymosphaeria variabile]